MLLFTPVSSSRASGAATKDLQKYLVWMEKYLHLLRKYYISIITKIIYAPDGCWLGEHGGVGGLGEDGGVVVDVVDVDDELRGAGAGRRAWADTAVWDIYILHSAGEMLLELEMKVHTKDRNHGESLVERIFTLKTLLTMFRYLFSIVS